MTDPWPAHPRPTMVEVARRARVSHQTVSRYLRFGGHGMKEDTRERVEEAVAALGYRPDLAARSMRTRRTGRVAVLLPEVSSADPSRIIAGAAGVARAHGFVVEILSLQGGPEARAERVLELSGAGQVEGILSLAEVGDGADRPDGVEVVVSVNYDDRMRGLGRITDAWPVHELIAGLAELGHRRFVHVCGPREFAAARARSRAYGAAVQDLGLESHGVLEGDWSAESGRAAVRSLPGDSGVTAVIAANDAVAAGVVRGAHERGWRVPDDLSVTGWDNVQVGAFMPPSLTTVDIDIERLGAHAMGQLIARIRGLPEPEEHQQSARVLWRESTGPGPRLRQSGSGPA